MGSASCRELIAEVKKELQRSNPSIREYQIFCPDEKDNLKKHINYALSTFFPHEQRSHVLVLPLTNDEEKDYHDKILRQCSKVYLFSCTYKNILFHIVTRSPNISMFNRYSNPTHVAFFLPQIISSVSNASI